MAGGAAVGVGIASAGPINVPNGTVSPINITAWQRFPIVDRVAAVTGLPVRLGGDGLCMAMGERWRGAGRGARFMLGMVVSTGIGGGLVLDGAPYQGRTGNAGHVGHVVVEADGAPCTCGGRGCVETVASGPHLVRWARENGWAATPDADARALAADANRGNPVALRAFQRAARALAMAIASVAAVCDRGRADHGRDSARRCPRPRDRGRQREFGGQGHRVADVRLLRRRHPEYWLSDARREPPRLEIYHRPKKEYIAARKRDGWAKSNVYGRSFRLGSVQADVVYPTFELDTR